MITRRTFLASAAASVVAPSLPVLAAPEVVVGVDLASGPDLLAFAVGTPGEFDWQHIVARTAEEAVKIWREESGYDDSDEFERGVMRVPEWVVMGGTCCDRCRDASFCSYCTRWPVLILSDPQRAIEALADDIACDGEAEVRAGLSAAGHWPAVQGDIWAKACAMARAA